VSSIKKVNQKRIRHSETGVRHPEFTDYVSITDNENTLEYASG